MVFFLFGIHWRHQSHGKKRRIYHLTADEGLSKSARDVVLHIVYHGLSTNRSEALQSKLADLRRSSVSLIAILRPSSASQAGQPCSIPAWRTASARRDFESDAECEEKTVHVP